MNAKHLIKATDFCMYHQLEHTFITDLQEAGLLKITIVDNTPCIAETELNKLERITRLYTELDINLAGIEAITHLIERIEDIRGRNEVIEK
ncbi:MerR family transcriptional regulator [Mucilaginibacter sp. S1162]|uniref:MerR family transcriptional regulator n=1 Tax=Mucilaginibacter humi TaxID=2732510 RepID=A0ABX1W359_9SPHI|nr:chaperone modulator CbpM [Mucilaginibacter humi]NNU34674.1 MerR family transcriptional regulator [Mucilaginibacter humi]